MFLNHKNQYIAKDFFDKIINIGINFKNNNKVSKKHLDINSWLKTIQNLNKNGIDLDKLLDEFSKEILPYCSNFWSVKFMGFPDAGNSIAWIWWALLSDFLQQNLINQSFCWPSATFLEINVIRWLREIVWYKNEELVNFDDVGWIITWWGTISNTIWILLWRENKNPWTMENWIYENKKTYIVVPKGIWHYSVKSAQMRLWIWNNLLEVETDWFRYDLKKLEQTLFDYKWQISTLVAYAWDSRTMTVDNFEDIYNLVKRIDVSIWLHADACHGFSLWCSKSLKHKLKWIEKFDSITTDPHKVFNLPYVASALLIKNPSKIKTIMSLSDLIMQEPFSFGQVTPFIWSKSRLSLKLRFFMKNLWKEWLDNLITNRHKIAIYLADKIKNNKNFLLLNNVEINSVVFMFTWWKKIWLEDLNTLNKEIHQKILREWKYHLHTFSIPDSGIIKKWKILYPLRFMSWNPNIKKLDINNMITYIEKIWFTL